MFGEGLTILNDEIFQLTWQEHEVFVYDLAGKLKRTMRNPREGWGLTNDGTSLIFSDGGPSFFFADPQTFAITREVKIKSDKPGDVVGLNELELIDGKLYGNIFQSNTILRIDPASGCIEARADMGSLWRAMTDADKKQVTASYNNVLNGIAYDKASGLFYVTGKRWRTIFVGRFSPRNSAAARAIPTGALRVGDLLSAQVEFEGNTAMKSLLTALAGFVLGISGAAAADIKPAIVFDMGGKFDKSFNEAAYQRRRAVQEGDQIDYPSSRSPTRPSASRRCAAWPQRGADPIIVRRLLPGARGVEKVARNFPNVKLHHHRRRGRAARTSSRWCSRSTRARSWSAWLAAMASKTGKVGFVGGMDIPLIRNFACGYEQGAKYVNPKVEVFQNMTGTTPAAWNDPARGRRARQEPVRPRRRRGLRRGRRHRHRRAAGREGSGQARDRRRLATRTTSIRARC